MKPESLRLFAKLMEKGYITREQDPSCKMMRKH